MIKHVMMGVALAVAVAVTSSFAAGSKCDATISKAAGKKVACLCGVYAKAQLKGTSPDSAKLAKCGSKFLATCTKTQTKGGCVVQGGSCDTKEAQADSAASTLCVSSAAPAFTD